MQSNPEDKLKNSTVVDSGCSSSMSGYKEKLSNYQAYKGGSVAFGNNTRGGQIIGKGTIKTRMLDFENDILR